MIVGIRLVFYLTVSFGGIAPIRHKEAMKQISNLAAKPKWHDRILVKKKK